jgi:hypothetical protein
VLFALIYLLLRRIQHLSMEDCRVQADGVVQA